MREVRVLRWTPVFLLGLSTIGAYGTAYYAIGVLIPAIEREQGWSGSFLASAFALGLLAQGGAAIVAGRVFDRFGSLPVLLPAVALGGLLLFSASFAVQPWQFVAAWVPGTCIIGGGLYYNVTMPIATRLYPENRAGALSVLTLLGALASPIFYPLAGGMIDLWGWQGATRGLVVATIVLAAPAAVLVRTPGVRRERQSARGSSLLGAIAEARVYRLFCVVALAGLANSALLLHQVPAMQAAGLSIASASSLAGLRGAFQIPGRLAMTRLVRLAGVSGSIRSCYLAASTAAVALFLAIALQQGWSVVLVVYFCAIGGMSLGLLSPLNGLYQSQVFGDERLGTLSGISIFVSSIASAAGAMGSAVLIEQTDSHLSGLAMVILFQVLAVLALAWQVRARADDHRPGEAESPDAMPALTTR